MTSCRARSGVSRRLFKPTVAAFPLARGRKEIIPVTRKVTHNYADALKGGQGNKGNRKEIEGKTIAA